MGWFSISDIWRTATEPVRLTFFCTPYPITTTSSIPMASSSSVRCASSDELATRLTVL